MLKKTLILLFLFGFLIADLFVSNFALANSLDYRYKSTFNPQFLSMEDGLSSSNINDILRDSQGYVWIATANGLNRFDGYSFKVFRHQHGNSNSLRVSFIHTLYEDTRYEKAEYKKTVLESNEVESDSFKFKTGLWLGTSQGISFLDKTTEKFTHYNKVDGINIGVVKEFINGINSQVYAASEVGLLVSSAEMNSFKYYTSAEGEQLKESIHSITRSENHLWVAGKNCFYSIDLQTNKRKNYCDNKYLASLLYSKKIEKIKYYQGYLWLGTNFGLIRFNPLTEKVQLYLQNKNNEINMSDTPIYDLSFDESGNLWMASGKGLIIYHLNNLRFDYYSKGLNGSNEPADYTCVYIDSAGLVWLGDWNHGLSIIDSHKTDFESILGALDLTPLDTPNEVFSLVKDNNEKLWVSSGVNGLVMLDLMTGKTSKRTYQRVINKNSNITEIKRLSIDINNFLWVSTNDGLVLVNLNNEEVFNTKNFLVDNQVVSKKLNLNHIELIYNDRHGNIYLVNQESIYKVESTKFQNGFTEIYLSRAYKELYNKGAKVKALLITQNQDVWIGTTQGLFVTLKTNQQTKHYQYQIDDFNSISSNIVTSLYEDFNGIIWVGTNRGLNKTKLQNSDEFYFKRITTENGLLNDVITNISEDNDHQLWFTTEFGLIRYSANKNQLKNYTKQDGLSANYFHFNSLFIDNEGTKYLGSVNGITSIKGFSDLKSSRQRKLNFTKVTIGNRSIDAYQLNFKKNPFIESHSNERVMKISVADMYYRKLATANYRYRLIGLDQNWIYLGKERSIVLAGLPEGDYALYVQSKLIEEDWPEESLKLKINVNRNFFETKRAFYLILILIFLMSALIIYVFKRFYQNHFTKIDRKLKVESLRLKEMKKENFQLTKEVTDKQNKITNMANKIDDSLVRLEEQKVKDFLTQTYYFKGIKKILKSATSQYSSLSSFDRIIIVELADKEKIDKNLGVIAFSEITLYFSNEIKKLMPADAQILYLDKASFLILAKLSGKDQERFETWKKNIALSKIPIANNRVVQIELLMSCLDFSSNKIKQLKDVLGLGELLNGIHQKENVNSKKIMYVMIDNNVELAEVLSLSHEELINAHPINWTFY